MLETWIARNVDLVVRVFGCPADLDTTDWSNVLFADVGLPPLFNRTTTSLLLDWQSPALLDAPDAFRFYIRRGLTLANGASFGHYFEGDGYNDLADHGWARLSLHVERFNPNYTYPEHGDTFVDLVHAFQSFMSERGGGR